MGLIIGIFIGIAIAGTIIHYRKKIAAYLTSFTGN